MSSYTELPVDKVASAIDRFITRQEERRVRDMQARLEHLAKPTKFLFWTFPGRTIEEVRAKQERSHALDMDFEYYLLTVKPEWLNRLENLKMLCVASATGTVQVSADDFSYIAKDYRA